jgi:hypothetical protein
VRISLILILWACVLNAQALKVGSIDVYGLNETSREDLLKTALEAYGEEFKDTIK